MDPQLLIRSCLFCRIKRPIGQDQHKKSTKQQRGGRAMKKPVSITVYHISLDEILGRVNYLMEISSELILLAIKSEENKLQEVMVGLAANVFTFMSSQESSYVFQEVRIIEVIRQQRC
ncbi:hypothetical protein HN51_050755 [Arachis hypogaea]